jgi:hypothetical protein
MNTYTIRQAAEMLGEPYDRIVQAVAALKLGKRFGMKIIMLTEKDVEKLRKRNRTPGKTSAWYKANPTQTPERRHERYEALKAARKGKAKRKA